MIKKMFFDAGPPFISNSAKPSLVASKKQRKQRANTKKNNEDC